MSEAQLRDAEVRAAVADQRDRAAAVVRFVHDHPELAHAEHACAAHLVAQLRDAGCEVQEGIAGMETAFRAVLRGGRPGGRVGIAVLYDAVATVRDGGRLEAVHSCGHGPIAGAAVALAHALAPLRAQMAGEIALIGCPADEIHAPGTVARGGGKWLTAQAGTWDDCDAALYAHPEFIDTVWRRSQWMRRDTFALLGERTLRDDIGQRPVEALEALLALARRTSRRRLMLEHVELDGDVEEGTGLALTGAVLCFGDAEADVRATAAALREALPDARWEEGRLVAGVRYDAAVAAAVADAFAAAGRDGFEAEPPPLPFATDFGNVSQRVPAALVGVGRPGGWAFHRDEGAAQFASPAGVDWAIDAATVLALAALRLAARGAAGAR